MSLGAPELIIILVIVLLLFGAKKLPDLASSMGKSIKEFRKATDEADRQADGEADPNQASATDPES
ncbi:MAG: twin-arginine translocase TatA/TatE family subunit [Nitriliruptorales bacterium]|nr:twin-arginine translocase TatA/TatE family subunit [Nitriliruptorales bacterium]